MAKRIHHKLIEAKFVVLPSMFRNVKFGPQHKKWMCKCGRGWLSVSPKPPIESFNTHVKDVGGIVA